MQHLHTSVEFATDAAWVQSLADRRMGEVKEITGEDRIELVALPETLEPYRMVKKRMTITTLEVEGRTLELVHDEVDTITWQYE